MPTKMQIRMVDISNLPVYKETRDCYKEAERFIESGVGRTGKICAFYGLKEASRKVLSLMAKRLQKEGHKCLYLICSDESANAEEDKKLGRKHEPEIRELFEILDEAIKQDVEYVFIEEITYIRDFVGQSNVLSNYYANQGLTIMVTGTDSQSFELAENDGLYGRLVKIIL